MSLTSIIRPILTRRLKETSLYSGYGEEIQQKELRRLLQSAVDTSYGERYGFSKISGYSDFCQQVPLVRYEDIRKWVMRMVAGESNVLWRGKTHNFAQSSGTSDGKSKYIPITKESFSRCHYRGATDCVAHYLALNPKSKIFDGKAFILGGSYANELTLQKGVRVGDLSANLIGNINPLANLVRIPSKRVALMEDWSKKLPALVKSSIGQNVTNISGVPSWFLSVIKEVLRATGADTIHEVWPNLEVFFHGGISFKPYRKQYEAITDSHKMHFLETYNASEGFFAVQTSWDTPAMLLLLDSGVFYEFIPLEEIDSPHPRTLTIGEVEAGQTYEMVITACNGLWRYRIGDTVRVEQTSPVKITIAGRTKHYINAFGEELMVHNADAALQKACSLCDAAVDNYTVAPVFATPTTKGHHEWLVEFAKRPKDIEAFADTLDNCLRKENSDYDAKRFEGIFIDRLTIVEARTGLFDDWLLQRSGKLGGQRKIPRLYNTREIIDTMLKLNNQTAI